MTIQALPPTPEQAEAQARGLQLFEYSGQQVRTLTIENEPWFVLADACKILDLSNPTMAATRIDSDDLSTAEVIDSRGRTQNARIVNESGLYDLAFMSRKPEARDFKRWVTREVLPTIRKSGSFVAKPKSLAEQTLEVISGLQQLVAEKDDRIAELAPKAAYLDTVNQSAGLRTLQDLTNDLKQYAAANHPGVKIYQESVYDLAGELGLIKRKDSVSKNQPTGRAIEAGWVKRAETTYETKNGEKVTKYFARLTPRGTSRVWEKAVARLQAGQPIFTSKNEDTK